MSITYSKKHPHEDRGVPPALRPDGGCDVCRLEVELEAARQLIEELRFTPSRLRALEIAVDELDAYHSAVGTEDPSYQSQREASKILREFLRSQGYGDA